MGPQGDRRRGQDRQRPHRREDHTRASRVIFLDLLVNARRRGRRRVRPERHSHPDRAGRHPPLLQRTEEVLGEATPRRRRPRPTAGSGSRSRPSTPASPPSTSSSTRPTSSFAAFEGHTAPLTVEQAHDVPGPQGRRREGHGRRATARRARARCTSARRAQPIVYKIVERHAGQREHDRVLPLRQGRPADRPAERHQPHVTLP